MALREWGDISKTCKAFTREEELQEEKAALNRRRRNKKSNQPKARMGDVNPKPNRGVPYPVIPIALCSHSEGFALLAHHSRNPMPTSVPPPAESGLRAHSYSEGKRDLTLVAGTSEDCQIFVYRPGLSIDGLVGGWSEIFTSIYIIYMVYWIIYTNYRIYTVNNPLFAKTAQRPHIYKRESELLDNNDNQS